MACSCSAQELDAVLSSTLQSSDTASSPLACATLVVQTVLPIELCDPGTQARLPDHSDEGARRSRDAAPEGNPKLLRRWAPTSQKWPNKVSKDLLINAITDRLIET